MLVAGTTALDTVLRVETLPDPDTARRADAIVDGPGGCGANVAYALARLGHQPTLMSAVGEGFEATEAHERLAAAGVDLDHLVRSDEAPTARAVLTTDAAGHQEIVYHEGATPRMTQLDPLPAKIGHFAPGELSAYPPLMAACETTLYDPGQETFYRPIEEVIAPIEHAQILVANHHEAERIADAHGGLEALVDELEAVVITDAEGQDLHTPDGRDRVPGVEAEAVDLTGAGDAHSAGMLHGLEQGWSLATACRFGSVLAAFAVEALGAQAGLPGLPAALERYVSAYGEASHT